MSGILTRPSPKLCPQLDAQCRVASRWALPHISSSKCFELHNYDWVNVKAVNADKTLDESTADILSLLLSPQSHQQHQNAANCCTPHWQSTLQAHRLAGFRRAQSNKSTETKSQFSWENSNKFVKLPLNRSAGFWMPTMLNCKLKTTGK